MRKKEEIVDALKFPKDVCLGALRVTMIGNLEAWIENYRGILEYSETAVLLQGRTCRVRFEGTGLCINYYTDEDMKLSGRIETVRYE